MNNNFTLDLNNEAATLRVSAKLAQCIVPNLTIFLLGDLGAGKTTFVRGLLRGLGHAGKVKSPTYTLLESYEFKVESTLNLIINHFDLYRFNDDEEWEVAGFRECFNSQSVCLVEWPEKAVNCLPQTDITIQLSVKNAGREMQLQAQTAIGHKVCTMWKQLIEKYEIY